MEIHNNTELRLAYEELSIWDEGLETFPTEKRYVVEEHIKNLKRAIRKYANREVPEGRVIHNEFEIAIFLNPLPDRIADMETATEWFEYHEVLTCRPSMYDCTGQMFTLWYKIFKRNGKFWAYHCVALDV